MRILFIQGMVSEKILDQSASTVAHRIASAGKRVLGGTFEVSDRSSLVLPDGTVVQRASIRRKNQAFATVHSLSVLACLEGNTKVEGVAGLFRNIAPLTETWRIARLLVRGPSKPLTIAYIFILFASGVLAMLLALAAAFGVVALLDQVPLLEGLDVAENPVVTAFAGVGAIGIILRFAWPQLFRATGKASSEFVSLVSLLRSPFSRSSRRIAKCVRTAIDIIVDSSPTTDLSSPIHLLGFSMGAIAATEYISRSEHFRDDVTYELATFGHPYDLIASLFPGFYRDREVIPGAVRRWTNYESEPDPMSSRFEAGGGAASMSPDTSYGSATWDPSLCNLNLFEQLRLKYGVHSAFFRPTADTQGAALDHWMRTLQ